jgi:hypothetical protein
MLLCLVRFCFAADAEHRMESKAPWRDLTYLLSFNLSQWLISDVNSVLQLLHCLGVGDISDCSEVRLYAASVVEVRRLATDC